MLILTRYANQSIKVPEHGITVTVLAVRGNQVKLGITAPREVRVLRGELKERDDDQRS